MRLYILLLAGLALVNLVHCSGHQIITLQSNGSTLFNITGRYGYFELQAIDQIRAQLYENGVYKSECKNSLTSIHCHLTGDRVWITSTSNYTILIVSEQSVDNTNLLIHVDIYYSWNSSGGSIFFITFMCCCGALFVFILFLLVCVCISPDNKQIPIDSSDVDLQLLDATSDAKEI